MRENNILNRGLSFVLRKLNNFHYFIINKQKLLINRKSYIFLKKHNNKAKGDFSVMFNKRRVTFTSPFWFLHGLDEIFVDEVYKFNNESKTPNIIDCGANVGLSVMYFKMQYPDARILAFEADPIIHKQLVENLSSYGSDITLKNAAVWYENTRLDFNSEGSVGGMVAQNNAENINFVNVEAIRLRDYLNKQVDFLKIDIEGAEYEVIKDCHDLLVNVRNLFIEYHDYEEEEQKLQEILTWVVDAGFKYYIKEAWENSKLPYTNRHKGKFLLQLNIFCFRI